MIPGTKRPWAHHPLLASSRYEETAYNVPKRLARHEVYALNLYLRIVSSTCDASERARPREAPFTSWRKLIAFPTFRPGDRRPHTHVILRRMPRPGNAARSGRVGGRAVRFPEPCFQFDLQSGVPIRPRLAFGKFTRRTGLEDAALGSPSLIICRVQKPSQFCGGEGIWHGRLLLAQWPEHSAASKYNQRNRHLNDPADWRRDPVFSHLRRL
jgi:hypothetical protein